MKRNIPLAQLALDGAFGVFYKDFILQSKPSAPISKTAPQATLIDLDGLANKATADFGLTWVKWNPNTGTARQEAACIASLRDSGKAASDDAAKKLPAAKPIIARGKFGRETYKFTRSPAFAGEKETHTSSEFLDGLGIIRTVQRIHHPPLPHHFRGSAPGHPQPPHLRSRPPLPGLPARPQSQNHLQHRHRRRRRLALRYPAPQGLGLRRPGLHPPRPIINPSPLRKPAVERLATHR